MNGGRGGSGCWTGPNGDTYEGQYNCDKRNGWGVYCFAAGASGAKYEGQFKEGKPHGVGVYEFRNGKLTIDSYEGGEEVGSAAYSSEKGEPLLKQSRDSGALAQRTAVAARKMSGEISGSLNKK